jgi:urea transporter
MRTDGFDCGPAPSPALPEPPRFTARETLLAIIGAAIALLLVATGTSFSKHDYRHGIWCFVAALVLAFVFFRKRKVSLVITGSSCILAFGGMELPFSSELRGISVVAWFCCSRLFHGSLVLQKVSVPFV